MIGYDAKQHPPTVWTDQACHEFAWHALDLEHHGNPAGYFLVRDLLPFIGYDKDGKRYLKSWDMWDYDGMRTWLYAHPERVLALYQAEERYQWWYYA